MEKITTLLFLISMTASSVFGQSFTTVPFNTTNWDMKDAQYAIGSYMNREGITLTGGRITVLAAEFLDGTIEVDINFPEARFFPGIFFRMVDAGNYENFYVRPHQSGNPDATQYTPVFNGVSGWQLYHGEGFSQSIPLDPDTWHRIKINVAGDQADIYFDDMNTPFLKVTDLKRDSKAGKIGLNSNATVHFANFRYSETKPELVERETKEMQLPPGVITSWKVSGILQDETYRDKPEINTENLTWTQLETEASGTINLARFVQRSEGMNTVIAKLDIDAEEETRKMIVFGYSDFVWAFVNGKQIYGGRNDFLSRDYRYLGTIGFFDSVYLPLEKGENEVLFVVGENFGGWGLKAFIPDQEGIAIR